MNTAALASSMRAATVTTHHASQHGVAKSTAGVTGDNEAAKSTAEHALGPREAAANDLY